MQANDLYRDISERTQGDIYIGVVGPVRTGKSTFIAKFMEKLVLPGIENAHIRARTLDELPQSGSGKTIMTTQPAFVPNEAAEITLPPDHRVRIRLIDSVGYLVSGALGIQEGEAVRMVHTPWSDQAIPFEQAAEIGTKKVIGEHSTIGIVVTTDGSVTDLPRSSYVPAEERVISELQALHKPYVVLLNTQFPFSEEAQKLRRVMEIKYGVPVIAKNVEQIEQEDICQILEGTLNQFPVLSLTLQVPEWLGSLDEDHWLIKSLTEAIEESAPGDMRIGESETYAQKIEKNQYVAAAALRDAGHGSGNPVYQLLLEDGLFNRILAEQCGTEIRSDAHLLSLLRELVAAKKEYDRVENALESVRKTGYGLVPPVLEEMTLQEPEIMKQGGQFGVKLRASAPSLHMIRVDVNTEVSPVVGTEQQSEEMIRYIMDGFEQDPKKLWESNLFGKPLSDLVREGLSNKLMHMPPDAQIKVQQTLEKIINEGSGGMLCILI